MGIGIKNVRNWGKDDQLCALRMVLEEKQLAYKVINNKLFITNSHNGLTLPFNTSIAELSNTRRGFWEAFSPFYGHRLATGVSLRDVIRATIQSICA
jgi:hypothetical protein